MTIMSDQLKKGTRVRLENGWEAVLTDAKLKGNARNATVYGAFTETGSIYVHTIIEAYLNGAWVAVLLNDEQKACKVMMAQFRQA